YVPYLPLFRSIQVHAFAGEFRLSKGVLRFVHRTGCQVAERGDGHAVKLVDGRFPGNGAQVDGLPDVVQVGQVFAPLQVQVEEHDRAGRLLQHSLLDALLLQAGGLLWLCFGELPPGSVGIQQLLTAGVDDVPLVLDELVVLPGRGVNVQHLAFGHALAVVDEVRDLLLIQATARIRLGFQALPGTTGFHYVVLQGDEEDRASGVALAARTPAQLVIQALGAEPTHADHVQSPGLDGDVAGGLVLTAELDVCTTTGHLGGDGDVTGAT